MPNPELATEPRSRLGRCRMLDLPLVLDRLAEVYGEPPRLPERSVFEWLVHENVAYLVDDARREQAYELIRAHQLLREHGQELCRRSRPSCERCPLSDVCLYYAGTGVAPSAAPSADHASPR
jgi:adenine-specific DNA glycosylase